MQQSARLERTSIAEWVRRALREARLSRTRRVEEKLEALNVAQQCAHPTADIDVLISEIEAGYTKINT